MREKEGNGFFEEIAIHVDNEWQGWLKNICEILEMIVMADES